MGRKQQLVRFATAAGFVLVAVAPTSFGAFPGRNGKLALEGDTKLGIYTVEPDGSKLTRITAKKPLPFEPAFSADGQWIAFDRAEKLFKMRADGSQQQKVAKYPGGGQISSCISWSPNGHKLAFDRDENIWTVRPNGDDAKRLTGGAPIDQCPSWSPDGKRIVFARSTNGNKDLVLMHVNGQHQEVLITPNGGTGFGPSEPDWAPDGKRIAFINGTGNGDIASIRPDGSGFKNLVATGKTEVDPAYSPNGKEIAYAVLINTHTTFVRRVSVNGGAAKNLTPNGEHWFNPSWQPR